MSGLLGPLAADNGGVSAQATFKTPWQAIVGARWRATPQLTLNAQAVRFGWSEFDSIQLGPPLSTAIPEGYRDTWSLAGGLDFALTPQWTLRGGVQYDETPTQNGARDPRVPDSNRVNLALGASVQATQHLSFDAGAVNSAAGPSVQGNKLSFSRKNSPYVAQAQPFRTNYYS